MTSKPATFACINHSPTAESLERQAFQADLAPVIAAIRELGDKFKQEIRVDLPAMTPRIEVIVPELKAPQLPQISVSVPEIRAAPISVTIPDGPSLSISYLKLAAVAAVPPVVFHALQFALSYWRT